MHEFYQENTITGQKQKQSVLRAGEPLERAKAAMILVHGHGSTAEHPQELVNQHLS